MSLKYRFLLTYGLGGLLLLFALTLLIFERAEITLERQLQLQFERDAEDRINGLQRQLHDLTNRFQTSADLPAFRSMRYHQLTLNQAAYKSDIRQLELYFYEWIKQTDELTKITFIDNKGAERLKVEQTGIRKDLTDRSYQPMVKERLERLNNSPDITEHHINGAVHGLQWWIPVQLPNGKLQGLLIFHVPYQQILSRFQRLQISQSGEVCLEANGEVHFSIPQQEQCISWSGGLWQVVQPVTLPGITWAVHIRIDPEHYLSELQQLEETIFKIILPSVSIAALLLITLFSFRFTRVIDRLVDYARHLGSEEEYASLNMQRKDELGILANEMERSANLIQRNRLQLKQFNQNLENEVEQRTHELVAANKAKDDFLASMSHELRTPLTSIIGNSTILLEGGHCGSSGCGQKDAQEIIHSIEVSGKNQLALVNDILDVSKIDAGKFTIHESPYNLQQTLNELSQMLTIKAKDAGLELHIEQRYQETHQLIGDAQRIQQILTNLLSNAIKFTEQGAVTLHVDQLQNQLLFSVKDSGIGMPPEVVNNLFQRFEQADGTISRRFGGSGLGLYISQNLAQLMGGIIEVESKVGSGSTFRLTLPYQCSNIPLTEQESTEQPLSSAIQPLHGSVLIAEDTPELQILERRILESAGLDVTLANNGQEAIDLAHSHHFDLILMDMQMPEVDGIEATRTLRERGNTTPIVALTANVMQKHRDAFQNAGCDGFLGKPIDRQELHTVLAQLLNTTQPSAPATQPAAAEAEVDDELMEIFLNSASSYRDQLMSALSHKDWEQLRQTAHTIKGSAHSFGFPELSERSKQVCDALDRDEQDSVPALAMDLVMQLGRILS